MGHRVLVVDDDPKRCQLLEVALKRLGHDPASVTSASEALQSLEDQDFDVIVTDIAMAEMDGLELCRRVQEIRPGLPGRE